MHEGLTRDKSSGAATEVRFVDQDLGAFGGEDEASTEATRLNTAQLGLWALLATLSMLFAGFTSAYLVRRAGVDWRPIALPTILWFNTALLLSSSLTVEVARASLRRGRSEALKGWLFGTTLLGLAFLVGQLFAWRQLAAQGIYVPTSPHSSFFYMLTAVHGAHLVGGLGALLYVLRRAWRYRSTQRERNTLGLCAAYWHFVDGLWVYLFLLMFAYR